MCNCEQIGLGRAGTMQELHTNGGGGHVLWPALRVAFIRRINMPIEEDYEESFSTINTIKWIRI